MSVPKRLRYQVLKRDNFTCRYCGAFAPVAVLVVDHVMPRKHGGQDVLENLVTACEPCNAGKSADLPGSWLIDEIEQASAEWRGLPNREPDEDDYFEMYVYQDSLRDLLEMTPHDIIHWIAQAFIAAHPYRPTHSELIRAAAGIAHMSRLSQAGG